MATRRHEDELDTSLRDRLAATRKLTLDLAAPLSDADATIQPFPDASPAKWHLAHTTWFFETFVLRDHVPGYPRSTRPSLTCSTAITKARASATRGPSAACSAAPRSTASATGALMSTPRSTARLPVLPPQALDLIELGINHEQQHQELFLTDILATFAENPLEPAYGELPAAPCFAIEPMRFVPGRDGLIEIGAPGDGFAFDSERPRHAALLHPHALANRAVTNGEWAEFIADGGYSTPTLWLSEGWDWVRSESVTAPLYWRGDGTHFTLAGRRAIDPSAPVAHVSFLRSRRLCALGRRAPAARRGMGIRRRLGRSRPAATSSTGPARSSPSPAAPCSAMSGTGRSAASRLTPASSPHPGAVGEYNGKFMSGQMVLKGASCATPRGHSRASYRNFFPPAARWQFTGVRLARDCLKRSIRSSAAMSSPGWSSGDPGDPGALALRPARVGAVRRNHPPAELLPDPHRNRLARSQNARDCGAHRPRARGRRIRRRLGRPRPRSCSARSIPRPMSRSTFRANICSDSAAARRRGFPAAPGPSGRRRLHRPDHPPAEIAGLPKLGFFPGSTIGNLVPETATNLLRRWRDLLGVGSLLLIGMDRVKPVERLLAAYDDPEGVTAAFNLNLLERINRELGRRYPGRRLRHQARWNDMLSRIEMHLVATRDIDFTVDGQPFHFAKGSSIHTENSHKYGPRGSRLLLLSGGWTPLAEWTDADGDFAVILAVAEPERFAP